MMYLVNFRQTPEERREKYWQVRAFGFNCYFAMKMRDWRQEKLDRVFASVNPNKLPSRDDAR